MRRRFLVALTFDLSNRERLHPEMDSPPSTLITFPVIQYVSGADSAMIAAATSSGCVSLC